jgi:hypothetical protein
MTIEGEAAEKTTHPCSFDEFKLYYESTERVTERRLNTNRWNYSISVGILLAVAIIYSWATSNKDYFLVASLAILFLSALAALFALFWLRQVQDWKALNNAKFRVLGDMAKALEFHGPAGPTSAKSFLPFDKEWLILQSKESLRRIRILRLGQIEALNASGAELFMPRVFIGLFSGLSFTIFVILIFSWGSVPPKFAPIESPPLTTVTTTAPATAETITPSAAR